jgi:threonylcarbamoyladenosine tRNA methylthiotransferase MtaB
MNVYLATLGCRLNEAELDTWRRQLHGRGHRVVGDAGAAEIVVVNSCAVTAEAARKSRKLARALRRRRPGVPVVMTGCWASLEAAGAAELPGVELVIDNRDKEALIDRIEEHFDSADLPAAEDASPAFLPSRTRAFVKVQDGCRNRCTFCIVTVARGEERSRPIAELVAEVRELSARGVREAVLTGVHLGGYGSDLGLDLALLLEAILADTDIDRLRLSSLEPWDLPADFHRLWDHPRLQPHLHLPLQSGCDATLKRMARRCPTARYAALVDGLRDAIAGLEITTDLIVGFPGETDAEWAATMAFVEQIGFSHIHVFPYSPRAGTAAARMRGRVPGPVARARSRQARALAATLKRQAQERHLGSEREVLWESAAGPSTGLKAGPDRHAGYTDNYLRVEARPELGQRTRGADLLNRITRARLESIEGDRIVATPIGPGETPRPRLKLPVL